MGTILFFAKFILSIFWLLIMSLFGIVSIPFLFKNSNFNFYVARFGVFGLRLITGVKIRHDCSNTLESFQPCIYVANHQDNFDIYIFGSLFPKNMIVIGKKEIALIPFFNLYYYAAGNIFLNRQKHHRAVAGISAASEKIRRRGVSVLVFPEGTRNRSKEGLLPFKKGAFHMAIETGLPIVPLVAEPIHSVLDHKARRLRAGVIRVRVLEPIVTQGMSRSEVQRLADTTRQQMLAALNEFHPA